MLVTQFAYLPKTRNIYFPGVRIKKILDDYNHHFSDSPNLNVSYKVVANKFAPISKIFRKKWHPVGSKEEFLATFTTEKWASLEPSERGTHTLRGCMTCQTKYHSLSQPFPIRSAQKKVKSPEISFNQDDMSTPTQFGAKLLREANSICQKKTIQQVIEETPKSRLSSNSNT